MHLIPIAWLYVALMMAVADAVHPQGSVLGALVTFLLYGLGPVALGVACSITAGKRDAYPPILPTKKAHLAMSLF